MASSQALDLVKKLNAKKAELFLSDNPNYKTSGIFRPMFESQNGSLNIKAANQNQIVNAMIDINTRHKALKDLGISDGAKHLGFPISDWIEDFKTRIAVLNRTQTLREIESTTEELLPLLTVKEKRELGVSELQSKVDSLLSK